MAEFGLEAFPLESGLFFWSEAEAEAEPSWGRPWQGARVGGHYLEVRTSLVSSFDSLATTQG